MTESVQETHRETLHPKDCLRLSMWSGPRNISTALMYSFRQRSDTRVFDEPLYGHYLHTSEAVHPGEEEVLETMDNDGERVVREVLLGPCEREVVFFKNMAHHLPGLNSSFLGELTNLLLTRDPREMLLSLTHQLPHPVLRDTGLKEQLEILEFVLEQGQTPLVIDAKEVLLNPEKILREVCRRLGLPFERAMLTWPAGPKPEDGVWAKHWYGSVHASTSFAPYRPKDEPFPERLQPLLDECMDYYERLSPYVIRAYP